MALRSILTVPHAALRTKCEPIVDFDNDDLSTLVDDMFETMYAAPGRGLAASQIGVLQRVFVMDSTWKTGGRTPRVFINPEIKSCSDEKAVLEEGCLSIPDHLIEVSRPAQVELKWQDLQGNAQAGWFDGFEAACVQHERDHLDGILCTDYTGD